MKKLFTLFLLTFFTSIAVLAQCPADLGIDNITRPTCGSNNGQFSIRITPNNTSYESSIDGGAHWTTNANTEQFFTNLSAGLYEVEVRLIGSTVLCADRQFVLRADYDNAFTATPSAATACNNTDGSIVLANVAGTDSVSWLSDITPVFVAVSSLPSQTINSLKPGIYYVIIKNPANNYCFSTQTITVGNSGTACPVATFCGNAQGPNDFPNGTFGAGTSQNGPPLPADETTYGYSQLAAFSPEDGFYAIANNTAVNGGGGVFTNSWQQFTDHTGDAGGYMMVVNADVDQDVVMEKTLSGLCPSKKYQFSVWIRNLIPGGSNITPNLTFLIDGVGLYNTGNITSGDWVNIGFTFQTAGATSRFSIRNNNPGGQGNDFVIDDIYVGSCVPTVALQPIIATCTNPPTQATAKITDTSRLYDTYQWELNKNDGNGFMNIDTVHTIPAGGFDATNSYLASVALPDTLNPLINNGWTYRIVVGTTASDLTSTSCSYTSTQSLIIQDCDVILPVKFTSISAQLNSNKGEVLWQVAEQLNVNNYELEKSTDGKNFSYVTSIKALTGATDASYTAFDNSSATGIVYYRIKIIDNSGKYAYSKVVTIVVQGNTPVVKVFPNPASSHLFVWMPVNVKINNAVITDAAGRMIMKNTNFSNTSNVSDIELNGLPSGFYTIRIIDNKNQVTNLSFIKQ